MYKFEDSIFSKELIDNVDVTPEVILMSNMFAKKIDFKKLSRRAMSYLKKHECETIGDAYFCVVYDDEKVGQKTREEIIFNILYSFFPCKYAVETQKAFLLSQQKQNDNQ